MPVGRYKKGHRHAAGTHIHAVDGSGYSLLWYDDTVAKDAAKLDVVKAIAKKYEGTKLTDKFIALPWTSKDGKAFPSGTHVALTHWTGPSNQQGITQFCGAPSGSVVKTFMDDYPQTDTPEPGAA